MQRIEGTEFQGNDTREPPLLVRTNTYDREIVVASIGMVALDMNETAVRDLRDELVEWRAGDSDARLDVERTIRGIGSLTSAPKHMRVSGYTGAVRVWLTRGDQTSRVLALGAARIDDLIALLDKALDIQEPVPVPLPEQVQATIPGPTGSASITRLPGLNGAPGLVVGISPMGNLMLRVGATSLWPDLPTRLVVKRKLGDWLMGRIGLFALAESVPLSGGSSIFLDSYADYVWVGLHQGAQAINAGTRLGLSEVLELHRCLSRSLGVPLIDMGDVTRARSLHGLPRKAPAVHPATPVTTTEENPMKFDIEDIRAIDLKPGATLSVEQIASLRRTVDGLMAGFTWTQTTEPFPTFWASIHTALERLLDEAVRRNSAPKVPDGVVVRPSRTVRGNVAITIQGSTQRQGRRMTPAQARLLADQLRAEADRAEGGAEAA